MKYATNKSAFLKLLEKSQTWKHRYRVIGELISKDISLELTGEHVPFPIVNFIYGPRNYNYPQTQNVFCQFFWVGQAYDCWLAVKIKDFRALPSEDWSHLTHTV